VIVCVFFLGTGRESGSSRYLFPLGYSAQKFEKELQSGAENLGVIELGDGLLKELNSACVRDRDSLNIVMLD
jgi:hypothetical protein